MKTVLLVVGRTVGEHYVASIGEYVERVSHYVPFEVEVIPELRGTKNLSQGEQKEHEGEMILKSLQTSDFVVLLDEHGTERRSKEFAVWLQKRLAASPRRLVFVVGVYQRGNERISLSQMTFSHQMIRLLFVEQFYRAMTILHGEPYHHE